MVSRLKVLVSAFACDPLAGSEAAVGFGFVSALAKHHDLWVLTAAFNQPNLSQVEVPGAHFVYVPDRPWHYRPTRGWRHVESSLLKPLMNFAYGSWLREAFGVGRRLHSEIGFDLVHQLTYVAYRFPGRLYELPIPFVWGPIGGIEDTPWRVLGLMSPRGAAFFAARNLVNTMQRRFLSGPRHAFEKARGGAFAATSRVAACILDTYGTEAEVICEVGPPVRGLGEGLEVPGGSVRDPGEPLRVSWSGLHLPGKALPLLLGALAKLGSSIPIELSVLGQGPETAAWQTQARVLGLSRITWHGLLPRARALEIVRGSHVFVITSLKDLTSTVLLEALALGVPVVALDHCGFKDVLTPKCGILVRVSSKVQIERDLASALTRLFHDEGLRQALALGALERVEAYSWEEKARRVCELYERAVTRRVTS
ncbi:MAG: glycosyltransferase [Deltaproteobacteria bacterium]|nr:glycosyltransferase [Deltaproteobacteria bacterium]